MVVMTDWAKGGHCVHGGHCGESGLAGLVGILHTAIEKEFL
jgi:hypothetical protein